MPRVKSIETKHKKIRRLAKGYKHGEGDSLQQKKLCFMQASMRLQVESSAREISEVCGSSALTQPLESMVLVIQLLSHDSKRPR